MPSLNLRNLLWSTRGKEWGFCFVHKPESHPGQWELIYQSIFGSDDLGPQRWHGIAVLPDGAEIKYVASRFFDPDTTWKDTSGREIPQEMFLDVGSIPAVDVVNLTWEYAVMNQVRGFYRDAYCMDSIAIPTFLAPSEDVTLPLTPCSLDANKLDIKLSTLESREQTPGNNEPRATLPLHETVRRFLQKKVW